MSPNVFTNLNFCQSFSLSEICLLFSEEPRGGVLPPYGRNFSVLKDQKLLDPHLNVKPKWPEHFSGAHQRKRSRSATDAWSDFFLWYFSRSFSYSRQPFPLHHLPRSFLSDALNWLRIFSNLIKIASHQYFTRTREWENVTNEHGPVTPRSQLNVVTTELSELGQVHMWHVTWIMLGSAL